MAINELKIKTKIEDMIEYAVPVLQKFPKSERYGMAADLKRCMDRMLERSIETDKSYFKKTTLRELDVSIDMTRSYLKIAFDLKYISMQQFSTWNEKIAEIGRMTGGLIQSFMEKEKGSNGPKQ